MLRYILASLLAGAMVFGAFASSPLSPRDLTREATLELSVQQPNGDFYVVCTAVAIDDGNGNHTLATAKHCWDGIPPKTPIYIGPDHRWSKEDRIVATDKTDTVLYHTKHSWPHAVRWAGRQPRDYEMGWKWGFPVGLDETYRSAEFAGVWKMKPDVMPDPVFQNKTGWMFNSNMAPGDSGGGFFGSDGKLLCIYSFSRGVAAFGFGMHVCVPHSFTEKQLRIAYGS